MRLMAALGALCFLATTYLAPGQVSVSAQTERTDFLLYERVDLLINVTNTGENDLVLDNNEGHPWLSFLVAKLQLRHAIVPRSSSFASVAANHGPNNPGLCRIPHQ